MQDAKQLSKAPLIDVIFLERVLTGGGAEKVVLDIASKLDRSKFQVSILTLFDGQSCKELLPDIGLHCLRPNAETDEIGESISIHWLLRLLRRVYHGLANEEIRVRLRIGLFFNHLLNLLRKIKNLFWRFCENHRSSNTCENHTSSNTCHNTCHNTFLYSLANHWEAAYRLFDYIKNCSDNAVLITVMEEAAIAGWLSQLYNSKLKYINWFHTLESAYMPEIYPDKDQCQVECWALGNSARNAAKVILPSQGCRMDLIRSFRVEGEKIDVVNNSINIAQVRRLSQAPFSNCGISRDAQVFRFVSVGRLSSEKNHSLLIHACSILNKRNCNFEVILVGAGPLENEIPNLINDQNLTDKVKMTGYLSNPYPLIASSDALVLTSNFEAFGVVLLEAMVCGTPIISTNCPTGPGEVLDQGHYGVLVPPNKPEALAEAMQRIIENNDLRIALINAGYEHVKKFDVRYITRNWENLIKQTHEYEHSFH